MRTFPPAGEEVLSAERLGPGVVWGAPDIALRSPLLARMDDAVRLVEVLRAPRSHVVVGARERVEPSDVGLVRIDLRRSRGHPLREHAPRAWTLLDPDGRRRPEVAHLDRLAEQ